MNLWLDGNRLLTVGRLCTAYDLLGLLFFLPQSLISETLFNAPITVPANYWGRKLRRM